MYFGFTFSVFGVWFFLFAWVSHYACITRKPSEMASGGPSGRSRPPAIETVKAKLYWSDHFGEPSNIDHFGEPTK